MYSSPFGVHVVQGAILGSYQAAGGPAGFEGFPTTDENGTPDGIGRYNDFSNAASIYWSPASGVHEVHGAIRAEWAATGWETGPLGYPVTDETGSADGVGRYNTFSKGAGIYWSPASGAHEVLGAIRLAWVAAGSELGAAGYPVSEEYATAVGRSENFQHAVIAWDQTTGVVTITPS